jgi:uncharacterized membrane protein YfcA
MNAAVIPQEIWNDFLPGIFVMGAIALLLFGTAWLAGSLLGSPAIASIVGIASVVALYAALAFISVSNLEMRWGNTQHQVEEKCFVVSCVVGLACFIAGCVHSLYRKTEV